MKVLYKGLVHEARDTTDRVVKLPCTGRLTFHHRQSVNTVEAVSRDQIVDDATPTTCLVCLLGKDG